VNLVLVGTIMGDSSPDEERRRRDIRAQKEAEANAESGQPAQVRILRALAGQRDRFFCV